jgi:hypothetical protein
MRLNRQTFYSGIRSSIHNGSLSPDQVASYEAILDAALEMKISDPRHLAYALATTRGEVGAAMQPVREIGRGAGKAYGKTDPATGHAYYGRGFVQLTWAFNYIAMGKRLGLDLYRNPDLALDRKHAARILIVGMIEGVFTKKKLSDYLNDKTTDYGNARRIINGTDRAFEFARYAELYERAIRSALIKEDKGEIKDASATVTVIRPAPDPAPTPSPAPAPTPVQEAQPRMTTAQIIIGIIAAALAAIFAWVFGGGSH